MSEQFELFELPTIEKSFKSLSFRSLQSPVWTENKARLIERYLYYFVLITHHGNYIDGFAGPQEQDKPETWAAKLVLESKPQWLRKFFLCEQSKKSYDALEDLEKSQPTIKGRSIHLYPGDFNKSIDKILQSGLIKEKEASFCLLDQRTFECQWKTLESLASFTKDRFKIELFYFLGSGWLHRAISQQTDKSVIDVWWGNNNWADLQKLPVSRLPDSFCRRFRDELGYRYAVPWPIYERSDGGKVMYHMIHATDHEIAPTLMDRSYRKVVQKKETQEQLQFEFEEWENEHGKAF